MATSPSTPLLALFAGVALLLPAAGARAQSAPFPGAGDPRFDAGGALVVGQPLGEFRDYVSAGFGVDGNFRIRLDPAGWMALRIDGGFLIYGRETNRTCLSTTVGCRIQVDVITSNAILHGGIGPEVSIPLGPVSLYGGVGAGFSWFVTDSEVRGTASQSEPFATTRNFSDGGFAWSAAGGIRIPVSSGETPVAIDLGIRRLESGRREYLTEGDITERPDGSLVLDVRRSEADLLLWRVGVSVGFSGRGGR